MGEDAPRHAQPAKDQPVTVAIDAMGGYCEPADIVAAVAGLSRARSGPGPVYFSLVGDEAVLSEALLGISHNPERIHVCHAPSAVGMAEPPQVALERKPDSSIAVACRLAAGGNAEAVVTAGNPSAAVGFANRHFGLLDGLTQPALAGVYPTPRERGAERDRFSLILDVGAQLRASADDLVGYALMGSAYARIVSQNPRPRVALLSTSREATIGVEPVRQAYERLRDHEHIHFYGCIEGHEIPRGIADVIVCEGFVGDVALKILEGVSQAAFELARSAYDRKFAWKVGLRLLSGGLKRIKQLTDFEEYGGAPLLGIDRVMIVAHPRSGRRAFENAIKLAIKNARARLPHVIAQELDSPPDREAHAGE